MDKVLQAEIYVNESDGQLRAAHLILAYNSISRAFQAPLYVIKAKDPRLRRISVAYEGLVIPQGIPLPRYSLLTEPLPVASLAVAVTSSPPPVFQVEEEEEVEQEEEGFVDLTSATDDYEVFNQSSPSPNTPEDMASKGNPSAAFKSYWRASQEGGRLGSLLNPNFLLPHLNLLFVRLSHPLPPGLNNLTLKGEGSPRARR